MFGELRTSLPMYVTRIGFLKKRKILDFKYSQLFEIHPAQHLKASTTSKKIKILNSSFKLVSIKAKME